MCGNESTSQPVKSFNQVVKELLADISVATPRTPDAYIASTRQLTSGANATVYAIAQCVENASQAICKNCLSTAYNKLYTCVPASEGRAINVECFMRYSEFPFFQNNQTINLVPFLGTGEASSISMFLFQYKKLERITE
ncbi:putative Gnk2-like domain-containing protein [Helianthus anomalus]